jgi:hypothetical protein
MQREYKKLKLQIRKRKAKLQFYGQELAGRELNVT